MSKLVSLVCVALLASVAGAAPIVSLVYVDSPAAGLDRYYLHAEAASGETNPNGWVFMPDAEAFHQVWPVTAAGPPIEYGKTLLADDLTGFTWDTAWNVLDTHCLFETAELVTPGAGGNDETNDGSDPAGLALAGPFGQDPLVGLGGYTQDGAALKPESSTAAAVDLIQIVVPSGQDLQIGLPGTVPIVLAHGSVAAPGVGNTAFEIGIPEPATLGILAVGGLLMIRRRR